VGEGNQRILANNQFTNSLEFLQESIQIIDTNLRYSSANNTLIEYETTIEELIGTSVIERYPGIEHTDIFSALELCMVHRKKEKMEARFINADQTEKWFELRMEPVKEGVLIVSYEITQRKEADEKVRRAKHLYAFISQINQNIVRVKDEATLFRNACHMAIEFGKFKMAWIGKVDIDKRGISLIESTGIPPEEIELFSNVYFQTNGIQEYVVRSNTYSICNDVVHDLEVKGWKPFADRYQIHSCMVLPLRKAGRVIGTFNLYSTEPNFSGTEEVALLEEVATDISFALDLFQKEKEHNEAIVERNIAEERLIYNNEELKKTNTELDRFVYSASHDLRAPLCSVLGLVSLIEIESTEPSIHQYSEMIRISIKKLDVFIRNILNYSKNNRIELQIQPIPLEHTVDTIIKLLHNMKEAEAVAFKIDIDEQVPFYSDIQRFTIIVENLISNAIKFQDYNRIARFIKIAGKSDKEYLTIQVADNGIGMAKEHLDKIFEMFFRVSGERDGTGIGLYIVKETVAKLDGVITVESNEALGTVFTIKLKNMTP
jgi:signal transduction histidine kinase